MTHMTDYQKLIEILSNQQPKGIETGDWNKIEYRERTDGGDKIVSITSDHVGFCFDADGNFKGIYNWKD
jgi:phosphorylcholine metabolism protein LicD